MPVIDHDSFLNNKNTSTTTPAGGALDIFRADTTCPYTGSLTISNSQFSGNTLITTSTDELARKLGRHRRGCVDLGRMRVAGHRQPGDHRQHVQAELDPDRGRHRLWVQELYAANAEPGQITATQSGNVFQSNSIVNTGSTATTFDGGGEWLASVNLTSTSDAYIGNSLPVQERARRARARVSARSWRCAAPTGTATATATNLVAAGNSIGTPSGGDVEGAGVYAGCAATTGTEGSS